MTDPKREELQERIAQHDLRRWSRFVKGDGSFDSLRCYCGFATTEDSNEAMFKHIVQVIEQWYHDEGWLSPEQTAYMHNDYERRVSKEVAQVREAAVATALEKQRMDDDRIFIPVTLHEKQMAAAVAAFKEQAAQKADSLADNCGYPTDHDACDYFGCFDIRRLAQEIRALPADSSALAAHDERLLEPFRKLESKIRALAALLKTEP